jgi:hypothetical protein
MTTKKQKREIAEKKRLEFEARLKADGLEAQKRDRERNEAEAARWREAGHKENERLEQILAIAKIHEASSHPFQASGAPLESVMFEDWLKFKNQTVPLVNYETKEVEGSAELQKMGDDIIAKIRITYGSLLNEALRMEHDRLMRSLSLHAPTPSAMNDDVLSEFLFNAYIDGLSEFLFNAYIEGRKVVLPYDSIEDEF